MLFTPENAREMAARGNAAKAARLQALRDAAEIPENGPDEFREGLLRATRAQAKAISKRIDLELLKATLDQKALTVLAGALATFEAIEQKLSMRAGPGNLKPAAPKRSASRGLSAPPPVPDDDGSP